MKNDKDISIGKDQWIQWIELDSESFPTNIDSYLESTKPFWKLLETECVSACCGIDAFALWNQDIKNAQDQINNPRIIDEFEQLKTKIELIKTKSVSSTFLNNLFDKEVFNQLLNHIISNLKLNSI